MMKSSFFLFLGLGLLFLVGFSYFGVLVCLEIFGVSMFLFFWGSLSFEGFIFCLSLIVISALMGLVLMVACFSFFNSSLLCSFLS